MSPVTSKPVFRPDINFKLDEQFLEERTTIVHCTYSSWGTIRIWPSTFLVQQDGQRKRLLHAFNIAEYPTWKWVEKDHEFTLIFEGLDKDCALFNLFEGVFSVLFKLYNIKTKEPISKCKRCVYGTNALLPKLFVNS